MKPSEPVTVTVNFSFPGTNVVAELITKENPMTPYRKWKIQALRASGYEVIVWNESDFRTPEDAERKMQELYAALGQEVDQTEWNKYREKRHELHRRLFGESGIDKMET